MDTSYDLAAYNDFSNRVLSEIRREAFGEDIGQFSWVSADEYRLFLQSLQLRPGSVLLDVACGSGGLSLYAAELTGCHVIGLDLSEEGIATASETAKHHPCGSRTQFLCHDASKLLPLKDESVDAIVCIDAINHLFNRTEVLAEWKRVLRPGGRFIFSDAVVMAGMLRSEEVMARSSRMGQFIFSPLGLHEHHIQEAGFIDLRREDVTATIASTARRWHDARASRRQVLVDMESNEKFEEMQQMLAAAWTLAEERRLLRIAFSAQKEPVY